PLRAVRAPRGDHLERDVEAGRTARLRPHGPAWRGSTARNAHAVERRARKRPALRRRRRDRDRRLKGCAGGPEAARTKRHDEVVIVPQATGRVASYVPFTVLPRTTMV